MNKLRYTNFWIDFQGDGRFPKEQIKGKDKRFIRKWAKREKFKNWFKGRYEEDYNGNKY